MPAYAWKRMLISSADGYIFLKVLNGISTRHLHRHPEPPSLFDHTNYSKVGAIDHHVFAHRIGSGKSTGATFSPSITTFSR